MYRLFTCIALSMIAPGMHAQTINSKINKQITMSNASTLHEANEWVKKGDYESFLAYCTENTRWIFVGERILEGKEQVRTYMKDVYWEPPVFTVEATVEAGNYVTVIGEITLKSRDGSVHHYDYCDIWQFENGKMAGVKAFVIEKNGLTNGSSD